MLCYASTATKCYELLRSFIMNIKVKLLPGEKEDLDVEVTDGAICLDILDKLDLSPDAHIITREGDPIPIDENLKEGEKIEIIKVVSGG